MMQAVIRKVPTSRQLGTTFRTRRRLGKRFNASDVIKDSTRTEHPHVTYHSRDRHSVTSHLRDRLMPAVMTASNTHGTHNNSTTGPFIETRMCCGG